MRLIDANKLNEHKFLTPQVKVIGGRRNGKTREQLVSAYQKGWNDAIDAIIDNAPTVLPEITDDDLQACMTESYHLGYGLAEAKFKRQQGEWEDYSVDFYKCPECGYLLNKDCPGCQTKVILPKGGAE